MKPGSLLLRGLLSLLAACYCALACGNSIDELLAAGHLHIASSLSSQEVIVPGQQIQLSLEVSTDGWFTGGTQIDLPEIPGLVILQTEQFASNASEIRAGQTWVTQRWTLNIFPQRKGDFTVGPVTLQVQVNAGQVGTAAGELRSDAHKFHVTRPASLNQVQQWVAAPAFSVTQSFNRSLENLAVGDAFEQEVVFEAADVLAMMLPVYGLEQLVGLAAYPSPPVLRNSVNRGQILASRSVRISYVVEKAGYYVLPATEFAWWNTHSSELELLSLPATPITVAAASGGAPGTINPHLILAVSGGLLLVVAILVLAGVYLPRLPLAKQSARLSRLLHRWRALRKPALASQLNPGSSAAD